MGTKNLQQKILDFQTKIEDEFDTSKKMINEYHKKISFFEEKIQKIEKWLELYFLNNTKKLIPSHHTDLFENVKLLFGKEFEQDKDLIFKNSAVFLFNNEINEKYVFFSIFDGPKDIRYFSIHDWNVDADYLTIEYVATRNERAYTGLHSMYKSYFNIDKENFFSFVIDLVEGNITENRIKEKIYHYE
jgi:hypothetical protein